MLKSNLKTILAVKKMSIREFARRIDYRMPTVNQLYNNEIKRIPADLIERACKELHCTVGELLYVDFDETTNEDTPEDNR